jgi:hypothetical protein
MRQEKEGGDLAQLRIVELGDFAPDARRLGERLGLAPNLVRDALGVLGGVVGDVVVDGFEVGACAVRLDQHPHITTARSRVPGPRSR